MTLEEAAAKLQARFQNVERTDFRGETCLELPIEQLGAACQSSNHYAPAPGILLRCLVRVSCSLTSSARF